jgi:hypothetical protein
LATDTLRQIGDREKHHAKFDFCTGESSLGKIHKCDNRTIGQTTNAHDSKGVRVSILRPRLR